MQISSVCIVVITCLKSLWLWLFRKSDFFLKSRILRCRFFFRNKTFLFFVRNFILRHHMLLIELNSISNMWCHSPRRASARNYTVHEIFTLGLNITRWPLLYQYPLLGSTTPLLLYFWLTLSPWVQDSSAWGCDECTMQFIVYCVSNFETWGILSFILTLLKVTMSDYGNLFRIKK